MPALSRVGTAFFLNKPGGGGPPAEPGEAIFHADKGSQINTWDATTVYYWTVPEGVREISVVCIGGGGSGVSQHDGASGCGGGLAFKNQIAVTPGSTIEVSVGGGGGTAGWGNYGKKGDPSQITINGTLYAKAGGGNANHNGSYGNGLITNTGDGVPGGDFDGGGRGGEGAQQGGCRQSGGGCGGYQDDGDTSSNGGNAKGGDCGNQSYAGRWATDGHGGAGGGGYSENGSSSYYASGGGGTGIYGRAQNGIKGDNNQNQNADSQVEWAGGGGSYSPWTDETNGLTVTSYVHNTGVAGYSSNSDWSTFHTHDQQDLGNGYRRQDDTQGQGQTRPDGGFPGGGGGGANSGSPCGFGGHGMVRIVWGTINSLPRRFPNQGVNKTDEYPGLSGATIDVNGRQMMY